jgi:1-aminocyclopropane-1-carboxylate deaminase
LSKIVILKVLTQAIPLNGTTVELFIRREDLIHPFVSGNKFRKLKYNLLEAQKQHHSTLLSFGGAFSNHIAALAYAGKEAGMKTIGIIRGEELCDQIESNPTLHFARQCGMIFEFVTREVYRNKTDADFIQKLKEKYSDFYLVPEGGTNELAVQGCQEILTADDYQYDHVCIAVGTGGTISGVINSAFEGQKILGFPALKGDFLQKDICKFVQNKNWELINEYHFGGYAKVTKELIQFLNNFYNEYGIPLDPVYTGKMVFGVMDRIKQNYFPEHSKILLLHTGGLQGIDGMNAFLKKKKLPILNYHG